MKTIILTLSLIAMSLSVNAQKITIKTGSSSNYIHQARYKNYNNKNSTGMNGHIEISTKGGWKLKFKKDSDLSNQNLYQEPISQKQLQKEKSRIENNKKN